MASSSPSLQSVDIPSAVPPNNTFQVDVTVRQESGPGPIGSFTTGGCLSKNLDVQGWVTPVTLWVDGERVGTKELCLAPGNGRDTTFSLSLSSGSHRVAVKVHPVGDVHSWGQSWKDNLDVVADDVVEHVSTSSDAPDPSRASTADRALMFLTDVADALGTSVNMVAVGIVIAAGVILFL